MPKQPEKATHGGARRKGQTYWETHLQNLIERETLAEGSAAPELTVRKANSFKSRVHRYEARTGGGTLAALSATQPIADVLLSNEGLPFLEIFFQNMEETIKITKYKLNPFGQPILDLDNLDPNVATYVVDEEIEVPIQTPFGAMRKIGVPEPQIVFDTWNTYARDMNSQYHGAATIVLGMIAEITNVREVALIREKTALALGARAAYRDQVRMLEKAIDTWIPEMNEQYRKLQLEKQIGQINVGQAIIIDGNSMFRSITETRQKMSDSQYEQMRLARLNGEVVDAEIEES